jgi:AcrR family transcriptional regulator
VCVVLPENGGAGKESTHELRARGRIPAPVARSGDPVVARPPVGAAKKAQSGRGKKAKPAPARGQAARRERKQQILVAAREVFAKRGYARTTVDDIALEAGVARGTFYLYFDDKRDAFEELVDTFAGQIGAAIVRIVTDDPKRTVAGQVLENIRAILGVCLAERTMTKILFTDAVGVDPEFEHKLTTFYDSVVQLLTESLKDGQALGVVADGEPRVLAYLTIGALKELLYQAVTLGLAAESAEALTKQVYDFLCFGYLRVETDASGKKVRPGRRA